MVYDTYKKYNGVYQSTYNICGPHILVAIDLLVEEKW